MNSVYEWDHNCQRIHDAISGAFAHISRELSELEYDRFPENARELLNYMKKWHYNRELYRKTAEEVFSRKEVIESLLQEGYGVSTALAGDMESFTRNEIQWYEKGLEYTLHRVRDMLNRHIHLSREHSGNSFYILKQLCRKLNLSEEEEIPRLENRRHGPSIETFFQVSAQMPPHAHMATLLKMFLSLTEESETIMTGSIGHINVDSPQQIKFIASRNIRELFEYMYHSLDGDLTVNIPLIEEIHYRLTRDLDSSHSWNAGRMRTEDFMDRSGLTFEYGNFQRGLTELESFLGGAGWHTDNFSYFRHILSMLYYMLIGIHPFTDSNGRTAKSLINFLLLRRGLTPVLFDKTAEVLCLPRYGGSPADMENYFDGRIRTSVHFYLEERQRLRELGLTEKHFFNIDFDSGFYFRHLNGLSPAIEINFKVYRIAPDHPLYENYCDRCRISVSADEELGEVEVFYGFTENNFGQWHYQSQDRCRYYRYLGKDENGVDVREATVLLPLEAHMAAYRFLEISVIASGRIFNNKSLNYSYRMDRGQLMKKAAANLQRHCEENPRLEGLKNLRDHLEWRSAEAISFSGLHDRSLREEKQNCLEQNSDIHRTLHEELIPSFMSLILRENLTGEREPFHNDNIALINHLIVSYMPATAFLTDWS